MSDFKNGDTVYWLKCDLNCGAILPSSLELKAGVIFSIDGPLAHIHEGHLNGIAKVYMIFLYKTKEECLTSFTEYLLRMMIEVESCE